MMHGNKEEFIKIIERASKAAGFPMNLIEKDYYLTVLLGGINRELDDRLVFKGGTCLNKVYFDYYRLSEDLDFTMLLPKGEISRMVRKRSMGKIKKIIKKYVESYGLKLDETENPGRNENKQYVYNITYDSILTGTTGSIKFEIGLRANSQLPVNKMKIRHLFNNPFTGNALFEGGEIQCLSLDEVAAEKVRAAATRKVIAPRDFFDLSFFIKRGFDFGSDDFLELVEKKFGEDGYEGKAASYYRNLSRSEIEINSMISRLEKELYPVVTKESAAEFNIDIVLAYFNKLSGL